MKPTVFLVALLFILFISAQSQDLSGKVAFVSLTTVQDGQQPGAPQVFAPNVLLQFAKDGASSTFLAMTNEIGVAVIPIVAGTYCVRTYGLNGRVAKLSTREKVHQCFSAIPGKTVEFGLTLAASTKYDGEIPSLGVN